MKRRFTEQLNKLTSLFLAAVLFLCCFESLLTTVYAENENTEYSEAGEYYEETDESAVYDAEPRPQEVPGKEADDYSSEADDVSEGYSFVAAEPDTAAEYAALPETYSLDGGNTVELYSAAYTLSQEEKDAYSTTETYTINCVEDWLKVEALSKEVGNFEGKNVNVLTPTDNVQGKYNLAGTGFIGLGSDTMPFAGTLKTALSGVSVNCDCPLIDYMSSKATIEQFVIGISGGNAGIAGTLIFEGEEDMTMLLKGVTVTGYLDDTVSEGVGGLFGTVINTTEHKFTIDAAKVTESEADNWGGINMIFSEHDGKAAIYGTNVGTFIGKIVGNVTFNVNNDFHITVPSLYGTQSTGSIVGKMEYNPPVTMSGITEQTRLNQLLASSGDRTTYPTIHFSEWSAFTVKNIQGTGYNGGVVGYTDHANIYNDTSNAILEITDSYISGGKAAGGFIGRAEHTVIDGTGMGEIRVSNSIFECTISEVDKTDGVSAGYVGGFIGIYGDGNSLFNGIAITVEDSVLTTVQNSSSSVTRYLGGLIGEYASTDDIVITPESEPVTIRNVDFKVYASNTHCGGFVSYVPKTAGSLYIDTSLYLNNLRAYVPQLTPDGTSLSYTACNCSGNVGGIASKVESNNLTVRNLTITAVRANFGRHIGSIAGEITGEDPLIENVTVADMEISNEIENGMTSNYYGYRSTYGSGAIAGRIKRNAVIRDITVTGIYLSPYLYYSQSTAATHYGQQGAGGIVGILGDWESQYTITDISNISVSGRYNIRNGNYNAYAAGVAGFVYPKTALCLDKTIDLSGITSWTASQLKYSAKYVGFQREALIYMEPTCNASYNADTMSNFDELGLYGGIYRNETFWDDDVINEASVSAEGGTYIIEKDLTMPSGIKINGTVGPHDGGWGLKTMGDYMRLTIVNNTIGYYGMECFPGAAEYTDISGGIFTAMNDMDLSARYMGVLTLNRNDIISYSSQDYGYSKYIFHGTFKGAAAGGTTKITLPGFTVYSQNNIGGLFSVGAGASFKDLLITGTLETQCYGYSDSYNYVGALCSYYYNKADVENVIFKDLAINSYYTGAYRYEGVLFGRWYHYMATGTNYIEGMDYNSDGVDAGKASYIWRSSLKNVRTENTQINANHADSSAVYTGGIASELRYDYYNSTCSHTLDFDDVDFDGFTINSPSSSGDIGGLFANTNGTHSRRITLNLNDVKFDNTNINTGASGDVGGFWGRAWNYTDVNLTFTDNTDHVIVDNSKINVNTASNYTGTRLGAVLHTYTLSTLDMSMGVVIRNTEIYMPNSTAAQSSFFISQANTSFVIFKDYRLIDTKVTTNATQFDELVGNSKNNKNEVSQQYNMGIVAISDSEHPFSLNEGDFHVYEYQSDYTDCPKMVKPYYNPYTRYYYNLDAVRDEVKKNPIKLKTVNFRGTNRNVMNIETAEQLMIWHIIHTLYYYSYNDYSNCHYLWRYFYDCFDDASFTDKDKITTGTLRAYSIVIDGRLDMSGLSFYPTAMDLNIQDASATFVVGADFDGADAGAGNNEIVFDYDTINTQTERALAAGKDVVVLKSGCTASYYYSASQHSLMQSGLFGYNSSITEINDISFAGSVGATRYNASTYYSGAAFCGIMYNGNSGAATTFKNIDLNGLYVVNPNEDYDTGAAEGELTNWLNYYGLLAGGMENDAMTLHFDTIETVREGYTEFLKKYPKKKAASALVGHVGYSSSSSLKRFDFANMSIADAEETDVLTANGTTLEAIHETPEDQIMACASYIYKYEYSSAEKGYYNFDDVCYFYGNGQFTPESKKKYYITLGKELGNEEGTTKTEYYNTSSLVGTKSYDSVKEAEDSDYIDFNESSVPAGGYWLNFSNLNYKPYIYNNAERDINVNYKSGDLDVGCGTYEDPYIISNAKQLYSLYCYLAPGGKRVNYLTSESDGSALSDTNRYPQYNSGYKTMLNEWKVNIPGTDDTFCDGTHTALTYDFEANPTTGFDDAANDKGKLDDRNARISVNLLRNAYYKINADIDLSDYNDFYGLCHFDTTFSTGRDNSAYFPFTGVIIGEKPDGTAPVITMPKFKKFAGTMDNMLNYTNNYGFVSAAKGCVLKNLTINYPEDGYARIRYHTSDGYANFGGAIASIYGGDNIIDNVRVQGAMMVHQTSVSAGTCDRCYRGGLVGACYGGTLTLRNLSTDDFADFDFKFASNTSIVKTTPAPDRSYTGELGEKGAHYDYINGIVGRSLGACILCESVDDPRSETDADGMAQKKLKLTYDDGTTQRPTLDFSEYDASDPQKMHAQKGVAIVNANYLDEAVKNSGKIKITRTGYDFETEISNNSQLLIYSLAMNSGAFYTGAGSKSDSFNTNYNSYYAYSLYTTRNNLCHVYHCPASYYSNSYDGASSYDVYSRCRKAKYDSVGNCAADNTDYKYAVDYDNIMTKEYFETDYTKFDKNSYKNYIGYNRMVSKYFEFLDTDTKDTGFWIMRRSGAYNVISNTYNNDYNFIMHNLYNVYKGGWEYVNYQGCSNLHLVKGTYDMTVFDNAFVGIGVPFDVSQVGSYTTSTIFNGDFEGNDSTVILDMKSEIGSDYAGLFNRITAYGASYTLSNKETVPLYELRNLSLEGKVENISTSYLGDGKYAGMLVGYCNSGRYKASNIKVNNAQLASYTSAGGVFGRVDSNTQLLMDHCTARNITLRNHADGDNSYNSYPERGGLIGCYSSGNNNVNRNYITDCAVSELMFDIDTKTSGAYTGALAGNASMNYVNVYNFTADSVTVNSANQYTRFGGVAGMYYGDSNTKFKNTSVSDVKINIPYANSGTYLGGVVGYSSSTGGYLFMENTSVNNIRLNVGNTYKQKSNAYFNGNATETGTTSGEAYFGGITGYEYGLQTNLSGVYIENLKMDESVITETDVTTNANGLVTASAVKATQKLGWAGGIAGYKYTYTNYDNGLRVTSLDNDGETVSATPSPLPTLRPMYQSDDAPYEEPAEPENPNKGKKSYIKNNDLIARYAGGIYGQATMNTTALTRACVINGLDITDNKIIGNRNYRNSNYTDREGYNNSNYNVYVDGGYDSMAGGVFGYVDTFNSTLYSNDLNIEHNVIGTVQNVPKRTYSGGVNGYVKQATGTTYYYGLTLKNNYIGPLDLVKDELSYYYTQNSDDNNTRQDKTYRFIHALSDAYNNIRTLSIDELGAFTRLFTDSVMSSSDSWDYSVTEPGTGVWYAQDNLYKYAAHVGVFTGYNWGTDNNNQNLRQFYIEPNIVYDDTGYSRVKEAGETVTTTASAHRPAVDEGVSNSFTADDDLYAYREYMFTVYDDADEPTKYGEWDKNAADYIVADALGYNSSEDNKYLFAQLKNIYNDYKEKTAEGYIDIADYDETAHTYRLKKNYGQVENGYTMDQVYDYIYYGYDRDTDGTILNPEAGPHYLSPYIDKDGKNIPMLVYKSQYGTPDVLVNTIINILTNNAGAYNTGVGRVYRDNLSVLNIESWKMELKDGMASAVYNADGTHKQGGFSVSSQDNSSVRTFNLEHTSYDTTKDDKNGTFTVLHVTYGYDSGSMSFMKNTFSTAATMTLDIPVYVSKLLDVQINMKTLDGVQLSQSNIAGGSAAGTVLLKSTNTVMAEYVYDYPRTMYDSVYLKKKLTFETSPGSIYLYKNTKITLIDVTNGDKEYYYYVNSTVANPQIPFESFVDENGNNYKTRDLADLDAYPILGTESSPFTDLRGQTWGGTEESLGDKFINDYGVGVERFIIIIDKSATGINADDPTGFTYHSVHVRVDSDNTESKLLERIRYDGRDYKETDLNTPTEDYPNPDWYGGEVNGYKAYNYITIREIDDVKVDITNGSTAVFGTIPDENIGIGPGSGLKASVDFSLTASNVYWEEIGKSATEQYLDFVISVQRDDKDVTLPVGTKYSFDGVTWYTIGKDGDYEYGKRQIYYYADRAAIEAASGSGSDSYKLVINELGNDYAGKLDIYFDFRDCGDNSFSDGNYYVRVDAYKTTKREFPVSGDYKDSWLSEIYTVYNSSNIGFALQEDDLLYRGINRYLPKVSDSGVIDFKTQLDFRQYLDEETGKIKDVVAGQYYTIGVKLMKKNSEGKYVDYEDTDNRFKFYYDRAAVEGPNAGVYDGVVNDDDPQMYGKNSDGTQLGGVTYKFTDAQLNGGSSISGVVELALRLVYNTDNLSAADFSNYKFVLNLYLSDETVSGRALTDGSSETLTKEEIKTIEDATASPLSDYLIFTLARLKTD